MMMMMMMAIAHSLQHDDDCERLWTHHWNFVEEVRIAKWYNSDVDDNNSVPYFHLEMWVACLIVDRKPISRSGGRRSVGRVTCLPRNSTKTKKWGIIGVVARYAEHNNSTISQYHTETLYMSQDTNDANPLSIVYEVCRYLDKSLAVYELLSLWQIRYAQDILGNKRKHTFIR